MAVMRQVGNFAESGALGISIMSRRHATSPGVDQRSSKRCFAAETIP
jgi:hypothetical protein